MIINIKNEDFGEFLIYYLSMTIDEYIDTGKGTPYDKFISEMKSNSISSFTKKLIPDMKPDVRLDSKRYTTAILNSPASKITMVI